MKPFSTACTKTGLVLAAFCFLAPLQAIPALAQSDLIQRLQGDRLGAIDPGTYEAGDNTLFTIDRDGPHFLLRFTGQPEVFVLYPDHASLGGRVLRFDSGKTALQITGWGGMTLYTDRSPGGLPVIRIGDSAPPALSDVSLEALHAAAVAEAQHLSAVHHLSLSFEAQWDRLGNDGGLRAECLDALQNAARGIDNFISEPAGFHAIAGQIQTVIVIGNGRPTLERKRQTLIVTFDPAKGFAGRASSRAIARALHTVFRVPGN